MSPWIAQYFLNPAVFWPGLALVSVPVVIHLINRLHYRRVQFAAMEFLLASQERNRRRVLLEQLLLLLLRILFVLLLVALVGRMVLSAQHLSLFHGGKSHQLVLLDDSGSMRDRVGDATAFEAAKAVVRKLVAEGANRPGTQRFTLVLASSPDEPVAGLAARDIDEALVDEVASRLEDLSCTHQMINLGAAIEAAARRIGAAERDDQRHLHVISDFRRRDWHDNDGLAASLKALDDSGVAVNLVRAVGAAHENLAISDLSGNLAVAAAGVPVTFDITLRNFSTRDAEAVRVSLSVDGRPLPKNLVFDSIPAGGEASRTFDVRFASAGPHQLAATLEADPLDADNARFMAVPVPTENPVLVLDGSPGQEQGTYVADALAADKSVTGYAPFVAAPDYLRQTSLDQYLMVYLVNVPELPADDVAALEDYVSRGGGLAWFLGDAVKPSFYNDALYRDGGGLFPALLASAPRNQSRGSAEATGPDLKPAAHPLMNILTGDGQLFLDHIFVNVFFPVTDHWLLESLPELSHVRTVASLQNGQPLLLEHTHGQGTVFTCLTAAGPLLSPDGRAWTNWANGPAAPSYVVFQLDLVRHVARREQTELRRTVGEPIEQTFSRSEFADHVEFLTPDGHVTQVKAVPAAVPPEPPAEADPRALVPLSATFRNTDVPGVYTVRLVTGAGQLQDQQIAFNVPAAEGDLRIVTDAELRAGLGPVRNLTIQPAGAFEWIRSEAPGEDVRRGILMLLVVIIIAEQALAYRLSYHPAVRRRAPAPAV